MKKIKIIIAGLICFGFVSCDIESINPDGDKVSEQRKLKEFHSVQVGGGSNLKLIPGKSNRISIESYENYFDFIEVEVVNGVLFLGTEDNISLKESPNFEVYFNSIKKISGFGAASIQLEGKLENEELEIDLSGAADAVLNLRVNKCLVECSGSSSLELIGRGKKIEINCSGASDVDASSFAVENAVVDASGASHVLVFADEYLEADASGASEIEYKGTPERKEEDSSGAGSIHSIY